MSSANLPNPAGSGGYRESAPPGGSGELAAVGGYDELAAIASDPGMRRHARRLAGDFFEDVLQETWYAVVRARAREPIGNLRGYFYRVLVNTASAHVRGNRPAGHPGRRPAARSRRGPDLTAVSAESDALPRLLAAARRDLLRRGHAELRQGIPACSPDPDRYRDVILAVAEAMLAGEGPASRAEINEALTGAYHEWFDTADATPATTYQRRCRARESIRQVLAAVIGPDDL